MAFFKFNPLRLVPLLLLFLAATEFVHHADAADYVVGDTMGWRVPQGGAAAYVTWASTHTFRTGDVLVFNFPTGIHDVAHVPRGSYDRCSSDGSFSLSTVGPTNITLNSTGPHFFICTFATHCTGGQKLAINVSAATSPPLPSPLPPTPGAPTMPPSTTPVPPSTTPVAPTMPPSAPPGLPTMPPSAPPGLPTMPPSTPPSSASPPTSPPTMGPIPAGGPGTSPSPGGGMGPPAPPPGSGAAPGPGGAGAGAGSGAAPPRSSATTTRMTSGSIIALASISIIFHRVVVM